MFIDWMNVFMCFQTSPELSGIHFNNLWISYRQKLTIHRIDVFLNFFVKNNFVQTFRNLILNILSIRIIKQHLNGS